MLTIRVPQAKLSPRRLWAKKDTRKRHSVPKAPPIIIKKSLNHINCYNKQGSALFNCGGFIKLFFQRKSITVRLGLRPYEFSLQG